MNRIKSFIKNFDVFNLGFSIAIYYVFMFGALPLFLFLNAPSRIISELRQGSTHPFLFRPEFVLYLLAGLAAFIGGYFLMGRVKKGKPYWHPRFFEVAWDKRKTLFVFCFLFAVGIASKFLKIWGGAYLHLNKNVDFVTSPYYGILAFFEWVGPFSLAIAFVFYFYLLKNGDPDFGRWRLFAWGTFSIEFVYGVFTGSRISAAIPVVIYLIARNYFWKKDILRTVTVGILMFFVVMTFQSFYRSPDIFLRTYSDSSKAYGEPQVAEFVFDTSIGRTDQARIITYIFSNTKEFLHGATFKDFFISLGPPRFIWRSKPLSINSRGNDFGHKIGYLTTDYKSAVGPTLVGDLYVNFALAGIIAGMFILGLIYRFIFGALINAKNPSLFGVAVYAIYWPQFISSLENWIAPVWVGMVKVLVFLLIIGYLLKENRVKNKID